MVSVAGESVRPKAFNVADAAKQLDLSERHMYRLIATGEIDSFSIGRKARRISGRAIDEYIAKKEAEAKAGIQAA